MKLPIARTHVPLLATILVCGLLYAVAGLRYADRGFLTWAVLVNLLQDNAFLGLAAIGMTFVILSGGIDLSVGAVIGCTSIAVATLIERAGWPPGVVLPLVVLGGVVFGGGMGAVVQVFRLPPFLVTLAGMFLARGLGLVISLDTITIRHPLYGRLSDWSLDVFPVPALVFLVVLAGGLYVARQTRFGRAVYAIGGNETSAVLMGLSVGRTKIGVYALSGGCAALAGVVYTLYTCAGNANAGTTLELDAIATVVIGGTLLSGGVGHVFGTLVGVLIYGIIQTAIAFEGTLSSWWTKIVVGSLLLAFILLQKLVQGGPQAAELRAASNE